MALLVDALLAALALPVAGSAAYLLLLTLLSGRPRTPICRRRTHRFDIVVPAHNEAPVIARTVASLRRIDWPNENYRILVCADNCSDSTAAMARAAGAHVIERQESERRGKGYALSFAFDQSRTDGFADAVLVIDADAEVSANILAAIAARLELGAQAVQVHYGVLNPTASWRTRLITIAKGSFHIVRSRARELLGLSCGIRGTGWCVTRRLLELVPYRAFSLTEDVEYGIELGLAGHRVAYADEAHCDAEMVSSQETAAPQRARWERGRFQLIRTRSMPLLRAALGRRDLLCLDLALDLLVLPLSYVTINVALLLTAAALVSIWSPAMGGRWLLVGTGALAAITVYVLRGWQLSGVGLSGAADLLRVPQFLFWKMRLMARRQPSQWQRTERERP